MLACTVYLGDVWPSKGGRQPGMETISVCLWHQDCGCGHCITAGLTAASSQHYGHSSHLSANMQLWRLVWLGCWGEMFRRIKLPNYPLFVAADFKKPWHCPLIAINLVLPGKRRQYCISGGCGARRSITPVRTCRHVNIYLDASRGAKEISIYFLAGVQEGAQPQLAEITTLPLHF